MTFSGIGDGTTTKIVGYQPAVVTMSREAIRCASKSVRGYSNA